MPYQIAPGHNNVAGLIPVDELINGEAPDSHVDSLGTFQAAREFVALDEITYDDGPDIWEWEFVSLWPAEVKEIEDTILNGARSGAVTVETKDRRGDFVQRNATLTLPSRIPRSKSSPKFGPVVFTFTGGRPTA